MKLSVHTEEWDLKQPFRISGNEWISSKCVVVQFSQSGNTSGLMHGSQPDVLVLCHEATLTAILGWPDYPIPTIAECMQTNLRMARLTSPNVRFAGISINTSKLEKDKRSAYLDNLATETGLPCVDPVADGSGAIATKIQDNF